MIICENKVKEPDGKSAPTELKLVENEKTETPAKWTGVDLPGRETNASTNL